MAKALNQNALTKIVSWAKKTFATKTEANAVVPISRGGTGQTDAAEAVYALILPLEALTGTHTYSQIKIPFIDENRDDKVGYIPFTTFQSWINNRTNSAQQSNTAYTTYMGRGIALVTSAPTSLNNGCIAGVY